MILWDFHATFVRMHELRVSVHTWIVMFFGSAQCLSTRKAKLSFHNINSWISSTLETPACIFSLKNLCNIQFHVDHILWKGYPLCFIIKKIAKINKFENGISYAFLSQMAKIDKFEKVKRFSHGNAQKLL